jgi:hypothetical protein
MSASWPAWTQDNLAAKPLHIHPFEYLSQQPYNSISRWTATQTAVCKSGLSPLRIASRPPILGIQQGLVRLWSVSAFKPLSWPCDDYFANP